jgi:putative spermidine/putrescine transport system permease protein
MRPLKLGGILILILCIFPLVYLAILSVTTVWVFPEFLPRGITGFHWSFFLTGTKSVIQTLINGFLLSSMVGLISMIIGFWFSYVISFQDKSRNWINLAYLPYAFAPVIYAFLLQFYFLKAGLSGTWHGVLLAQMLITIPFVVILCAQHWTLEMKQLMECVYSMGGSEWYAFRSVILPVSRPVLLLSFAQSFLFSWFDFGFVSVIGVGKTKTLMLQLYQYIQEANPYIAACSAVVIIIPAAIFLMINSKLISRMNVLNQEQA